MEGMAYTCGLIFPRHYFPLFYYFSLKSTSQRKITHKRNRLQLLGGTRSEIPTNHVSFFSDKAFVNSNVGAASPPTKLLQILTLVQLLF